jgi:hypothetical protein
MPRRSKARAFRASSPSLAGFVCDPDLLARPPLRPLGRHEIEAWLRGWGRLNLDEIVDHEAGCAEQSDPVPVRDVKLDGPLRFEFHAIPCKVVPNEAISDRAVGRRTRQQEGTAREEDEPPLGAQEPMRLREPRHLCGLHQTLAPYSDTARSKLSLSKGTTSAFAGTSGNMGPNSYWNVSALRS